MAGGAAGNLIDRIRSGRGVMDFLDVGVGALRWPTFNIADIAVSCGAIALAISLWREDSRRPPKRSRPRLSELTFTVSVAATERLDRFLADQLGLSRTQAARLVADGAVTRRTAQPARASRLLARADRVVVRFPEHEPPRTLQPASIPLNVLFEDEHLAVIDKPAGLVVHPAPGHWDDTLVNALVARGTTLSGGAEGRPGIVHRLDRDTSGLMVVAKTDLAHRRLGAAIAARRVQRSYAALAWGHLDESPTSSSTRRSRGTRRIGSG